MKWLKIALVITILAIGVSLVLDVDYVVRVMDTLQRAHLVWLAIALFFQAVWILNQTALYQSIYNLLGLPAKFSHLFPLILATNFANLLPLPASLGGTVLLIQDARRRNFSVAGVTVVNFVRIALTLIWIGVLLIFSLIPIFLFQDLQLYHIIAAAFLLLYILLIVGGIVLAGLKPGGFAQWLAGGARIINRLIQRLLKRNLKLEDGASSFAHNLGVAVRLLWSRRNNLWKATLYTILLDLLQIMVLFASFRAVGYDVSLEVLVAGYSIGNVLRYIAITPAGVGFIEGGMTGTFAALGIPWSNAVTVVLVYRAFSYLLPVIAGFIALRWVRKIGSPTS